MSSHRYVPENEFSVFLVYFLDALEYIHDQGYIHADIKAENILRRYTDNGDSTSTKAKRNLKRASSSNDLVELDDNYYLIDYGLVEKFTYQGVHRAYESDKRKENNGTCEYRSRDAHIGVISRRSDIESLGFNLILWLYGRHPWGGDMLKDAHLVHQKKCWAMRNITAFLKEAFSGDSSTLNNDDADVVSSSKSNKSARTLSNKKAPASNGKNSIKLDSSSSSPPKGLHRFFEEVNTLAHDARPDYEKFKEILKDISKINSDASKPSSSSKKLKQDKKKIPPAKVNKFQVKELSPILPANKLNGRPRVNGDSKSTATSVSGRSALRSNHVDTDDGQVLLTSSHNGVIPSTTVPPKSVAKKAITSSPIKHVEPSDADLIGSFEARPRRRLPRLSTPLVHLDDSDDTPLFTPSDLEDSVKENRLMLSRTRSNSTVNDSVDSSKTNNRKGRPGNCHIYIANKPQRSSPRKLNKVPSKSSSVSSVISLEEDDDTIDEVVDGSISFSDLNFASISGSDSLEDESSNLHPSPKSSRVANKNGVIPSKSKLKPKVPSLVVSNKRNGHILKGTTKAKQIIPQLSKQDLSNKVVKNSSLPSGIVETEHMRKIREKLSQKKK